MMNHEVDNYFEFGCGRFQQGQTPDDKVHKWSDVLKKLRILVLDCGLNEELKWGVPVYTFRNKSIVLIGGRLKNIAF